MSSIPVAIHSKIWITSKSCSNNCSLEFCSSNYFKNLKIFIGYFFSNNFQNSSNSFSRLPSQFILNMPPGIPSEGLPNQTNSSTTGRTRISGVGLSLNEL